MKLMPRSVFLASLAALTLASGRAEACSVPVFRYALERWPADAYEVIVFHEGELDESESALVRRLEEAAGPETSANLVVRPAKIGIHLDEELAAIHGSLEGETLPLVVLRYPEAGPRIPKVWSGPLTEETVRRIVDSPVRKKVAKEILAGRSAVWILVESGDEEADREAAKTLETSLRKMEETLELPELDPRDLFDVGISEEEKEGIRISFSAVRLSRKDEAEGALLAMLLHSEPDLVTPEGETPPPMTFPVFGRGRALYALLGAGINEDVIADACTFLTGPCSCQIKHLNPGVDLLMAVDWDAGLGDRPAEPVPAPDLTGFERFLGGREGDAGGDADATEAGAGSPEATLAAASIEESGAEDEGLESDPERAYPQAAEEVSAKVEQAAEEVSGKVVVARPVGSEGSEDAPDTPSAAASAAKKTRPPGETAPETATENGESGEDASGSPLVRNSLIALAIGLAAIIGMALLLRAKPSV